MKGTLLLNYNEDTKKIEEEERTRFLKNLLDEMGVPINDFWGNEISLSVNQKIKLRSILATYDIQVIENLDGHMQIYVDNKLIGEWQKCTYKLKKDLRQLDPRRQLYLEMEVNCWSLFEEQENE